jgi:argininosuccinate lyase
MMDGLQVNEDALIAGCTPELYATDVVLQGVLEGKNFRDTYKDVGLHLEEVAKADPLQTIMNRSSIGTTGNLGLDEDQLFVSMMKSGCDDVLAGFGKAYQELSGLEGVETVLY